MLQKLPEQHPLTHAHWIWPQGEMYLQNCYAQFRHDFTLMEIPEHAPFFITADQQYRLSVNGVYVCRGPARGYQAHWPYDEVDVRRYLKTGHNFISVEAYNPGIGTFQYLHYDSAGLLCAAEWGNVQIHTNKATWQMRRAPGNNPNVARLSRQMAFQEDFDASEDDSSWITSPEIPDWSEKPIFRWEGEWSFGTLPWATLEERGIPMLKETVIAPARISSHGVGTMADGYRTCFNISWHWRDKEANSVQTWLPGETIPSSIHGNALEFSSEATAPGQYRAIVLEFDQITFGSLILELENCTGNEIVDCHYHQYLEDGYPHNLRPSHIGMIALATRLRTAKGFCGRMFFVLFGARYITLIFRDVTQTLNVRASWRTSVYPFHMHGLFQTSDQELNEISRICRNTQQICSADAYMDTPWREQGQWWGDARIQARNTFYFDGDTRLLLRGIVSIAGQDAPYGLTYGVAPCRSGRCILPDFSLTWILSIYDYYFQTDSLEPFFEYHDRIQQIFAYFEQCSGRCHAIHHDSRFWLFEDWADLPKKGFPTFINLFHLYTLQHYEILLHAANLDSSAVSEKISFLKRLLVELFFDFEEGLFQSGIGDDGSFFDPPTLHDQILAILLNLCPEYHERMLQKRILPFLKDENCPFATPTSFWCSYLFDAMEQMDVCRKESISFIRKHWSRMIPTKGTWETLNWKRIEGQSCCHAWSAHAEVHIVHLLLGLKQLAPGWKKAECRPAMDLLPEKGTILLPLPVGDFIVEWSRDAVIFQIPSGMEFLLNGQNVAGEYTLDRLVKES